MLRYTGNIRYRKIITGSIIVEIEYKYDYSSSNYNLNDAEERTAWKKATGEDLAAINSKIPIV